eukprot:Rmarinus@m.8637
MRAARAAYVRFSSWSCSSAFPFSCAQFGSFKLRVRSGSGKSGTGEDLRNFDKLFIAAVWSCYVDRHIEGAFWPNVQVPSRSYCGTVPLFRDEIPGLATLFSPASCRICIHGLCSSKRREACIHYNGVFDFRQGESHADAVSRPAQPGILLIVAVSYLFPEAKKNCAPARLRDSKDIARKKKNIRWPFLFL